MPTRKQRRRAQKERRHEYETVWVDEEGNELEEPPDAASAPPREQRSDGKPKAKAQRQPQGRGRAGRTPPPPPSWRRSIRRSVIWIAVLGLVLVWVQSKAAHPNYLALAPAVALYVLLFPAMTYYIDRLVYRRYQAKNPGQRDAKKR